MRIDFDTTATEIAEMHLQIHATSDVARSFRRREQVLFVVVLMLTIVAMYVLTSDDPGRLAVLGVTGFALVVALALVIPFGWVYDDLVRKRTHRLLREQLGGEGPHACSVELRPEHLWVRQNNVELLFPWTEATSVSDNPDGVLIVFRNGRVLARNRGFSSPEQRREFLEIARASATMKTQ